MSLAIPVRASLLVCLLAGCGGAHTSTPAPLPPTAAAPADTQAAPHALTPAEIAAAATPSIVSIRTPLGLGTGFVVRDSGWIVTNLHVITGADRALVTFPNKQSFPVLEVLNTSAAHDLALLRVDAKGLPVLKLADSEKVRPGDAIVAIGHPLGLEDTVSNGLVSAVRQLGDLTALQISAPIAPGSSGGPLLDEHGEVVGVATAILHGGQNLNLGVPAKYVQALLQNPTPVTLASLVAALPPEPTQPALPKVSRQVPHHELSIWAGCDQPALALVGHGISDAIDVGAPLYNDGNFAACYHVYEGAALDIERRLPKACKGPKLALASGRGHADKLSDPSAQAWAMRDAFDGLTDVLMRHLAAQPR